MPGIVMDSCPRPHIRGYAKPASNPTVD